MGQLKPKHQNKHILYTQTNLYLIFYFIKFNDNIILYPSDLLFFSVLKKKKSCSLI